MAAAFRRAGYDVVPFGRTCEVCVVHGCTVTRAAELKSLRCARAAGDRGAAPLVVLAGCIVETAGGDVKSAANADLAVGQRDKLRLPEIIDNLAEPVPQFVPKRASAIRPERRRSGEQTADVDLPRRTRALVKTQDGCDFHCAYCIVPAARGRPVSRPACEIVAEVRGLAQAGYREIVLTGANLGCYSDGHNRLTGLLTILERIAGIERIRLSSIELSTVEREIVDYMVNSEKLCRYLHVPLQTGDDELLAAMGRRYTVAEYRAFVEYACRRIPLLGLGTDVVSGLPGETERAFANTMALIRDLPFNNLHVFPYSRRTGTRAASMAAQVPASVKKRRAALLRDMAPLKLRAFAERCLGRPVAVLVEQLHDDGSATGWTGEYVEARLPRPSPQPNSIVPLRPRSFDGRFLTP